MNNLCPSTMNADITRIFSRLLLSKYLNLYFHPLAPQSCVSSPLLARHLILCKLIAHHMGCDTRLVSIQIIVCVSSPRECAANLLGVHLPNDSCLHTASLEGSLSQCDFLHFNKALAPQIDKDTQTHSPLRHAASRTISLTAVPRCSRLTPALCECCAVMIHKHKVCNIAFICVTTVGFSGFASGP